MDIDQTKQGRIEVICGPMFAGKSSELIRRVSRCVYAGQKSVIFSRDSRYGEGQLKTHSGFECSVSFAESATDLLEQDLSKIEVLGIDEGQFFGPELSNVCKILANRSIRVIVSGLDMDFEGQPFHNMANLMGIAEHVSKLSAICKVDGCSNLATRTFRTSTSKERILEGGGDDYMPTCRSCFNQNT